MGTRSIAVGRLGLCKLAEIGTVHVNNVERPSQVCSVLYSVTLVSWRRNYRKKNAALVDILTCRTLSPYLHPISLLEW